MTSYMFLLFALIVVGLLGFVILFFQTIWNMTMPEVFGVRGITFWQSVRILVLAGFLAGPGCVSVNIGGRVFADAPISRPDGRAELPVVRIDTAKSHR
jgi:hypothetical protein